MSSFLLRDQRLAKIALALERIAVDIDSLTKRIGVLGVGNSNNANELGQLRAERSLKESQRSALDSESSRLRIDSWKVRDRTVLLVALDNLWANQPDLQQLLSKDVASTVLSEPSPFTAEFQANLNALPRTMAGGLPPESDRLQLIRQASNNDQAMLDQLLLAIHHQWLERVDDSSPYDHVGIMLPVRIETIFIDDSLWIRLIPDEVSISRHRRLVSAAEQSILLKFWQAIAPENRAFGENPADWLKRASVSDAWNTLCRSVAPSRAAWLVSNFPPQILDQEIRLQIPATQFGTPEEVRQQRDTVRALPENIEVWATHQTPTGIKDTRLGTIRVRDDALARQLGRNGSDLDLIFPKKEARKGTWETNWLTNFEAAIQVGLGARLSLEPEITASSIVALYVVGIGDTHPGGLFSEHCDAGTLGVMRLGTATNSVNGAPAADLAADASGWLSVARARLHADMRIDNVTQVFARLQHALLGNQVPLPQVPLPLTSADDPAHDVIDSHRLVQMLWPALWGHYLRDHLVDIPKAYDYWHWCTSNLYPEGPIQPIRIKEQPYGLLPVSSTSRWSAKDVENRPLFQVESEIAENTSQLRQALFQQGKPPTLVGADTQGILDVLARDAITQKYTYRYWLPFAFLKSHLAMNGMSPEEAWQNATAAPLFKGRPIGPDLYLVTGNENYLDLSLIIPKHWPEAVKFSQILTLVYETNISWFNLTLEFLGKINPDSLLVRLMIESLMLAQAWIGQELIGTVAPVINPATWTSDSSRLQSDRARFLFQEGSEPLGRLSQDMYEGMKSFASEFEAWFQKTPKFSSVALSRWERALRATLDSACHRLDPWVTGLAWRRLNQHAQSDRAFYQTGLYGWVDGPFSGQPGPTESGVLHAPSYSQAITSSILRDKFLTSRSRGTSSRGRNPWEMQIDSRSARDAHEIAEESRMGCHLFEIVGRKVEQIVGDFQRVRGLRKQCPQNSQAPSMLATCHGIEALDGLRPLEDGEREDEFASRARLKTIRDSLTSDQRDELRDLHNALNTYADLLIADAVHDVVTAQPHRAANAMDSMAGIGAPPTLESIRTPPSGYRLTNTVVSVIPYLEPSNDSLAAPCHIGEASLTAFLETLFPNVDTYEWSVKEKSSGSVVGRMSLEELGWSMAEAALLSEGVLADIVLACRGGATSSEKVVEPPKAYFACRKLWGSLGRKPASQDLFQTDNQLAETGRDPSSSQLIELTARLNRLRTGLTDLVSDVENKLNRDTPALEDFQSIVKRCLSWGIVPNLPGSQPSQLFRFLFANDVASTADIAEWSAAFLVSCRERLSRLDDEAPADLNEAAKKIVACMCAEGGITILAKWTKNQLLARTQVDSQTPVAALQDDWLPKVAAVREDLARLEAVQMQGSVLKAFPPLDSWSNSTDPWQTQKVQRALETSQDPRFQASIAPMVAAFGPANAWSANELAVGLIDEYQETIPLSNRNTYAAFGFNAPASRAPQAVLLAVPPIPKTSLSNQTLLEILQETREMTRVRAMRPQDLQGSLAMISSVWLPGAGSDGVQLENEFTFQI